MTVFCAFFVIFYETQRAGKSHREVPGEPIYNTYKDLTKEWSSVYTYRVEKYALKKLFPGLFFREAWEQH
jgi:hypothetical protein